MTDHIKQWARRPGVQLWTAYIALVMLGALAMIPACYFVIVSHLESNRIAHDAAMRRLHEINVSLVEVISRRLPTVVESVGDAAQVAKESATVAREAAQTAKGAGATARGASNKADRAASTAEKAASALSDALVAAPSPPKDAPDWLDGQ